MVRQIRLIVFQTDLWWVMILARTIHIIQLMQVNLNGGAADYAVGTSKSPEGYAEDVSPLYLS
jgi:hypothetical protein